MTLAVRRTHTFQWNCRSSASGGGARSYGHGLPPAHLWRTKRQVLRPQRCKPLIEGVERRQKEERACRVHSVQRLSRRVAMFEGIVHCLKLHTHVALRGSAERRAHATGGSGSAADTTHSVQQRRVSAKPHYYFFFLTTRVALDSSTGCSKCSSLKLLLFVCLFVSFPIEE